MYHQVYGPRKVWKHRREGCAGTVGRLMRAMGLEGAVRGRAWVTTTHAGNGSRPADLGRQFVATNQLWVSATSGVGSPTSLDVFARRIVGWRRRCARTSCSSRPSTRAAATR